MKPRHRRLLTTLLCGALTAGVLYIVPAQADPVGRALGYAYGASGSFLDNESPKLPEVQAAVPAGTAKHDEDVTLSSPLANVSEVEADACIDDGTWAVLQHKIDRARYLANGGDSAQETPQPDRVPVDLPEGYPDTNRCVTPAGDPAPPPEDTTGFCEEFDPAAEPPQTQCLAPAPLWNGRGYAKSVDALEGNLEDAEAEAVARCEEGTVEFATAAEFSPISGGLAGSTEEPNQILDPGALGLGSGTLIFWETNWDPVTNTTMDGSDTVWVNALHLITPGGEAVVGRAEATAACPDDGAGGGPTPPSVPTPPAGGFPRDINMEASKGLVRYNKSFTLAGSVTPATEFSTPHSCVENVEVIIRRDVVGGPNEFEDVARVTTDQEGNFSYLHKADRNAQWIAFIDKDNPQDCAQVASSSTPVLVKPRVILGVSRKFIKRGRTVRFKVTVKPCEPDMQGTRVKLKRVFQSRGVKVGRHRINDNCQWTFKKKAKWKKAVFNAAWPKQTDDHQNGKSQPKVVRTRKK